MAASDPGEGFSVAKRPWYEARSDNFRTFSCAPTQEVARLTARLEQFREAYAALAGSQAVASPPIIVMAFPDRQSMRPFVPLYQDQPSNLAAFFNRGSDENLIALTIAAGRFSSLEVVFHEYAHLLMRHNQLIWPLWLKEGMADVYSTFQVAGRNHARIGLPINDYILLLRREPMTPLVALFDVTNSSPEYNERERQGMFYAQSWLLTHYLMLGDNPALKARFGQFTTRLRQGEPAIQAFTNALGASLPALEQGLRAYLARGKFDPLLLSVRTDLNAPRNLSTRLLSESETHFRLGNQLLRIGRLNVAAVFFQRSQELDPKSSLPCEGLGLLAAERDDDAEAIRHFETAFDRGPKSFLTHYAWARSKYRLTSRPPEAYARLDQTLALPIRRHLHESIRLMPSFGPAHHLLGFFEMVQGDDLATAEKQIREAIRLEPEKPSYLLSLAQVQLRRKDLNAVRRTLEPLLRSNTSAKLRATAEDLLQEAAKR